ncbi:MAG: hypothetical protein HKN43_15510 [Rhodothermales bacterium]|nr:hypothetical protein [Rhodothermales bacterium]
MNSQNRSSPSAIKLFLTVCLVFLLVPVTATAQVCLGECPENSKFTAAAQGGADNDTDLCAVGIALGANQLVAPVLINLVFEYGIGNQNFGTFTETPALAKLNGGVESDDYRSIIAGAQVRYPFVLNEANGLRAGPMAGIINYNWNYKNCDFCEAENEVMVQVGGTLMWGFLGLDAYTSIDGPGFSVRLRAMYGFGAAS